MKLRIIAIEYCLVANMVGILFKYFQIDHQIKRDSGQDVYPHHTLHGSWRGLDTGATIGIIA